MNEFAYHKKYKNASKLLMNRGMLTALVCVLLCIATSVLRAQELKKEIQYVQHKYLPFYNLKKTFNTTIFQGNKRRRNYFEGWYFKMVSQDGTSILSIIPGISLSSDGQEQHAFIQTINGITAETNYYSFPIEEFSFSRKDFAIKIGNNYFSKDSIELNLKDNDSVVSGKIKMSNTVAYESGRLLNPGIMGWYRFVPFMECYHGVVSLTHELNGKLTVNNNDYVFDEGKGYIEKDWGSSMPSSWIWMQSNNFTHAGSSFMLSIANIPWQKKSFTGFLGFFYHNNKIHHFATYRPTKLNLEIDDSNELKIHIENRKNAFVLNVRSNRTGLLKAPVKGLMDRRIPESIDAIVTITMMDKKGNIILRDSSTISGLEMVGDYHSLSKTIK